MGVSTDVYDMKAIQGIGGAGIAPSVMMAISDLVTLRERGKYQVSIGIIKIMRLIKKKW